MSRQRGKQCKICQKFTWYPVEDHFTAECCGEPLNMTKAEQAHYINSVFDVANIQNDDRARPGFHNGLNEYLPSTATWSYVQQRAAAKGLSIERENDHTKMRGTRVDVPRRAR